MEIGQQSTAPQMEPASVSLADFPLELQIQILSKRAFSHLDDLFMRDFNHNRDIVEAFYDKIRNSTSILVGPVLHFAWHGGVYDCHGWGRNNDYYGAMSILQFVDDGKEIRRRTDLMSHWTRQALVVYFSAEYLDEKTGDMFNSTKCQKTKRLLQMLYVFSVSCTTWPLPLLTYSWLNPRDEINFKAVGPNIDTSTAFQTLMNKRCWTRTVVEEYRDNKWVHSVFLEHGYTDMSPSASKASGLAFKKRKVTDLPKASTPFRVFGFYELRSIFRAWPKQVVSNLITAAGVTMSPELSQDAITEKVWQKLYTLQRGRLYTSTLQEVGPLFGYSDSRRIIGIFLPFPWITVHLDMLDYSYIMLHDYMSNLPELETVFEDYRDSLNRLTLESIFDENIIEDELVDKNQPLLHRIITVLRKDGKIMACHCGNF